MTSGFRLLPFDIYLHILVKFPVSDHSDDSVKTLSACLRTNSTLREAASLSKVWEPHYKARYTECVTAEEELRKQAAGGDFRLMYMYRRRLDQQAVDILNGISMERTGRQGRAAQLAISLSYDVWNALELETRLTPAEILEGLHQNARDIAPHAIPRRFWAKTLLGVIGRSAAVKLWAKLRPVPITQDMVSFETAFAALSTSFEYTPTQISSSLDALGSQCRAYLSEKQYPLDPDGFNDIESLKNVCFGICEFMSTQGFGPTGTRRLGICASPLDFPTRVIAIVKSPNPEFDDLFLDIYGYNSQFFLSLKEDIPSRLIAAGESTASIMRYVSPASSASMLLRASRNILASPSFPFINAIYTGFIVNLIFTNDDGMVSNIIHQVTDYSFPLDICAVLVGSLAPSLNSATRQLLITHCGELLRSEENASTSIKLRSQQVKNIKFFVGMMFKHIKLAYVGCIIGWAPTCMASEDWIIQGGVDAFPRGRHQPFYTVIFDNSTRYVAEENIGPHVLDRTSIMEYFSKCPMIERFFEGVRLSADEKGRARLLPAPELQLAYPEDDRVAEQWLKTGIIED
ncbi:hypothetical protein SERLA73DRAFT_78970 [Serpula lacrymans var. lacrymans S7.3]|uniref:Hemimethylated DNA-binding domain-containing protein n=1 Tax=Serpula lacrymans var. lacrymans (strain S7.3) TaxID=936435 RepID=F8QEW5_SERL3|nr:hypothetical protein SERLA73DRAFT_78970 [Serpula lacrymans var. lacrymans S7.3]